MLQVKITYIKTNYINVDGSQKDWVVIVLWLFHNVYKTRRFWDVSKMCQCGCLFDIRGKFVPEPWSSDAECVHVCQMQSCLWDDHIALRSWPKLSLSMNPVNWLKHVFDVSALPVTDWYTSVQSLNSIRATTGSQWTSINVAVTWSHDWRPDTRWAAEFKTRSSCVIVDSGTHVSTVLQ